jgi:hypothetical protein
MDTQVSCTFEFYTDDPTNVDAYGMPTKDKYTYQTTVIFSPVRHDEEWIGQGIDETADARIIVHELLDVDGNDMIDDEWFTRDNVRNIIVVIGDRNYRILSKRGHVELRDVSPYHVVWLQRVLDEVVVP